MENNQPYDSSRPIKDSGNARQNNSNINHYQPPPEMSFGEAIKACFDKYAEFEGRSRRTEYWYFRLFQILVIFGLALLAGLGILIHDGIALLFIIIMALFALGTIIPGLAVTVRRFHDAGQSGWLILLDVFCTSGLVSIVMGCIDSQHGHNQYGPNPKGVANDW